jgi:hypothetical protein
VLTLGTRNLKRLRRSQTKRKTRMKISSTGFKALLSIRKCKE